MTGGNYGDDDKLVFWALLSAVFAALTAIFAKVGLEEIDPDLATLIRTVVILVMLSCVVYGTGKWSNPLELPPRMPSFLMLSGLATGASWACSWELGVQVEVKLRDDW